MVEAAADAKRHAGGVRTGSETGGMENYPVQSIASSLSDELAELSLRFHAIRFRTCMLWVAIGQAPGLFLYTYLGTLGQLGMRLRGKTHPRPIEYLIWGGGLVTSVVLLMLLVKLRCAYYKRRKRASAESLELGRIGVRKNWHQDYTNVSRRIECSRVVGPKVRMHLTRVSRSGRPPRRRGRVFTGVNVENISYGLTMCAERVALGRAIDAGSEFRFSRSSVIPRCPWCRVALVDRFWRSSVRTFASLVRTFVAKRPSSPWTPFCPSQSKESSNSSTWNIRRTRASMT